MRAGVWKCGLWHVWKIKGGLFGSSLGGFSLWVLLVLGWLLWVFFGVLFVWGWGGFGLGDFKLRNTRATAGNVDF